MSLIKNNCLQTKKKKRLSEKNGHKQSYTKILIQDLKSTAAKKLLLKNLQQKKQQLSRKKIARSNYGS